MSVRVIVSCPMARMAMTSTVRHGSMRATSAVTGTSVRGVKFSRAMRAAAPRLVFATRSAQVPDGLSDGCKGAAPKAGEKLPIKGSEEIMSQKAHGTTDKAVQQNLRYGCDRGTADNICRYTVRVRSLHP
eukprot:8128901-Pyramimonas_sp.AAC.1